MDAAIKHEQSKTFLVATSDSVANMIAEEAKDDEDKQDDIKDETAGAATDDKEDK